MNRLLLTAVTALTMGVSSHAMAASYTLDSFSGTNAVSDQLISLNGAGDVFASSTGNYVSDGFTFSRGLQFTQTAGTDGAWLFLGDVIDGQPLTPDQVGAYVMNSAGGNATLALTYNIGSIASTVGNGSAVFNLTVTNADAGADHPSYITAFLNGSATPLHTWTIAGAVPMGDVPSITEGFSVSGADLTANSQISFVMSGANGYNTTLAPLTFDVLPVPEAGLLPMFGSGLLVVGFAARRKIRARSL